MDKAEVNTKTEELKEACRQAQDISQEFYEELLREYANQVGDNIWEQILEVQEKHDEIEKQLPNVADDVFDEYVFLGDLLAVLLNSIKQ